MLGLYKVLKLQTLSLPSETQQFLSNISGLDVWIHKILKNNLKNNYQMILSPSCCFVKYHMEHYIQHAK